MILLFPDLDTFTLAVTSKEVPLEVSLAPAKATRKKSGELLIEPSVSISRKVSQELKSRGVSVKRSGTLTEKVQSWLELLPLSRQPAPKPEEQDSLQASKTPILFELPETEQLPELVGEMLRLGNSRQSYRNIETSNGEGDVVHTLLRVVGPPYYTLLRALEADRNGQSVKAFREQAARVWVEVGYVHPLAEKITPPPGQFLLIESAHAWRFVEEAKFHDVYDVLEFTLPEAPADWQGNDLEQKLTVPMRLTRGTSQDVTELWVVRENSIAQLDELVQGASDTLLTRISFAVVEDDPENPTVVLRARPGKQAPPVLVLNAIGYASYLKLPNLFLPVGHRLHPPLRRDAVKKLLASETNKLTWLQPTEENQFAPQSILESAFHPLENWVDYILDREANSLSTWMQATQFDFEPFICPEEQEAKDKKERKKRDSVSEPRPQSGGNKSNKDDKTKMVKQAVKVPGKKPVIKAEIEELPEFKPSELQLRLRELEKEFLALDAPADDPERQAIWIEMANLNGALSQSTDATICWMNLLWEDGTPDPELVSAWFHTEQKWETDQPLTASEIDTILKLKTPAPQQLNALIAHMVWAVASGKQEKPLVTRLSSLQEYLEKHEGFLPVRVVWLAWSAMYRLSDGDVLALARARDRLLERLYQQGLSPDRELPSFLRASGSVAGERFRAVRDKIIALRERIHDWRKLQGTNFSITEWTRHFIDLFFSYGLARLSETDLCQELLDSAATAMTRTDKNKGVSDAHQWFRDAFTFRIRTALENKPHTGQLPASLLDELPLFDREERYKIDRLRQKSSILEPNEKIEPYRKFLQPALNDLGRELTAFFDLNNREELAQALAEIKARYEKGSASEQAQILTTSLELAPRLGEGFAIEDLGHVLPILEKLKNVVEQARLLDKGITLAGHYDQPEHVQAFVSRLHELLKAQQGADLETIEALESLMEQSLRGMRKLGMRDEIASLLEQMQVLVEHLKVPKAATSKKKNEPQGDSPQKLKLMLRIASGWFYFSQDERAWPALIQVRDLLFSGEDIGRIDSQRVPLTCSYIAALGQAPVEEAMTHLEELFSVSKENGESKPKLQRISDSRTTSDYYVLSQLEVVEAVVMALVSDDFTLDKRGRQWLDEDEFRIRRRIHQDVRDAMAEG